MQECRIARCLLLAGGFVLLQVACGGSRALPGEDRPDAAADGAGSATDALVGDGSGPDAGSPPDAIDGTADAMPEPPPPVTGCVVGIASGDSHVCVVNDDGMVSCLGANSLGQLGNGSTITSPTLVPIPKLAATLIAAGGDHTCVRTAEGGIACWGGNRGAELGVSGMASATSPVSVPFSAQQLIQITAGQRHTCALDTFFHGYCWGTTPAGSIPEPRQIGAIGLRPLQYLHLGGPATRLLDGGRLYDVPWKEHGQLLAVVPGAEVGVIANATDGDVDCIVKQGGTVWCRGEGHPAFYALLADFGHDVVEVKVGESFVCARSRDGGVRCRGSNDAGQLGDGTMATRSGAVQVSGVFGALELALGDNHACARLADGSAWCWGTLPGTPPAPTARMVSRPKSPDGCGDVRRHPSDGVRPAIPEPSAADLTAEASLGWAQNACLSCSAATTAEACVRDELVFSNGCVQALGQAVDMAGYATCVASAYWELSQCRFECGAQDPSGGQECSDLLKSLSSCGTTPGVFAFCVRNSFPCGGGNGEVHQSVVCDGITDCTNGFDEANCTRGQTDFRCADGSRANLEQVFDGKRDCPDGTDEAPTAANPG